MLTWLSGGKCDKPVHVLVVRSHRMPLPKVSFLSVSSLQPAFPVALERFPQTPRAVCSLHLLGKEGHWGVYTRGPVKPSHIRAKWLPCQCQPVTAAFQVWYLREQKQKQNTMGNVLSPESNSRERNWRHILDIFNDKCQLVLGLQINGI